MTYVKKTASGSTELEQVWGLRREFYELFMSDYLVSIARVDPLLIELCRLQMATLIDCDHDRSLRYIPAIEAGLTEEKISALPNYLRSELYSERERICIEFAELFVIQSSNIDDANVARVQTVMDAEEFIYFVKALSVMDMLQRACTGFDIRPPSVVPGTMGETFQLANNLH